MILAMLFANFEGNILVERFNGVSAEERLHWRSFLVKLGADNLKGVKNEELLVASHNCLNFEPDASTLGSASEKKLYANHMAFSNIRAQAIIVRSSTCKTIKYNNGPDLVTRRDVMGLLFGFLIISLNSRNADGAGLPPKEKLKLCDDACENELENVPMVTTESSLQYKDIKVGEGPSSPVGFQIFFSSGLELMELLDGHYDILTLIGYQ